MTLDLPLGESVSEAYEVGPVVEARVGDVLWRVSAKRRLAPVKAMAWMATYERRAWININGVATWHWVNEHRLPMAGGESAEECLRGALAFIDRTSPLTGSLRDVRPPAKGGVAGEDLALVQHLAGRIGAAAPETRSHERAR